MGHKSIEKLVLTSNKKSHKVILMHYKGRTNQENTSKLKRLISKEEK